MEIELGAVNRPGFRSHTCMDAVDRPSGEAAPRCVLRAWNPSQDQRRGCLRHHLHGIDALELADDLLHKLFVRALRQDGRFCAVDSARGWLFQVAE